jgi:hypothetical protein
MLHCLPPLATQVAAADLLLLLLWPPWALGPGRPWVAAAGRAAGSNTQRPAGPLLRQLQLGLLLVAAAAGHRPCRALGMRGSGPQHRAAARPAQGGSRP